MHGNGGDNFSFSPEHWDRYCNRIVEKLRVVGANSSLAHLFELKLKLSETYNGLGCEAFIGFVTQRAFRIFGAHLT